MTHDRSIELPDPCDLIELATRAVVEAGALLRAEFHRPGGPRGAHSKAPIDSEIENSLRTRLLAMHSCDWHGEELPHIYTGHSDVWVVDPHDGTRGFLKGLRGSSISVALLRNGKPVLGIVYAPMAPDDAGDLFAWADGLRPMRNGAALIPIGPNPAPVKSNALPGMLVSCADQSHEPYVYGASTVIALNEEAGDFAAFNHRKLGPASVLAMPSIAYRLALSASGEVDVAVSLTSGLDPYDVAGGHALLNAVGGGLVQLYGDPILYGPRSTFQGCIGGRPEMLQEIIKRRLGAGTRVSRNPVRPARRIKAVESLRRAQGVLLGQLAGDALGSSVEFQSAAEIRRHYPHGVVDLSAGGTWSTLAGQPTDDSELALALARCLVTHGAFDRELVSKEYVAWGKSKPFDIGGTTRMGLDALSGRGRWNTESQSNGALMRVSPIGIFASGQPELAAQLARVDAALTHPNSVCSAASAAYAAAIAAGVDGAERRAMWEAAHTNAGDDAGAATVRACLESAIQKGPSQFMHNQGWVLTALANAFHRLYSGQTLEEAVIETVAAGGDTDTNAAICGALLGASQGRDGIPLRWRRIILGCRPVSAPGVRHPRPNTFWPDDALDLAEALLATRKEKRSSVIKNNLETLSIGQETSFQSLTMIPLTRATYAKCEYQTLDDAFDAKRCRVEEISESGSVSELKFANDGDCPVFLLDGEELVGAKQNRVLNLSILAPASCEIEIPVSCVEQGRWRYRSREFKSSGRAHYARGRAEKARSVSLAMERAGSRRSDQYEVWEELSRKADAMQVASDTDSMSDIYDKVAATIDDFVEAFSAQPGQVGALFLIGGKIAGMDVFDHPSVLGKLLPKLVRSYALDAIEVEPKAPEVPPAKVAESFMAKVAHSPISELPAVGLGADQRFDAQGLSGGALVVDDRVIHMVALPI